MMPPAYQYVPRKPVIMLDVRKNKNRASRRRAVYGKQTVWERLEGKLSPKEQREWGL